MTLTHGTRVRFPDGETFCIFAVSVLRPQLLAQVRILNLDPEDCLKALATQQVNATPDSLLLLESPAMGVDGTDEGAGAGALFLHIGGRVLFSIVPIWVHILWLSTQQAWQQLDLKADCRKVILRKSLLKANTFILDSLAALLIQNIKHVGFMQV